jgi:ppGpp synthetase/RelA/SpoT-type nucleotidyltranferase
MQTHTPPPNLRNKDAFLATFHIPTEVYRRSGFAWSELREIYADYLLWHPALTTAGSHAVSILQACPSIRGAYSRVKDPEHLIEKLIRKSAELDRPYATYRNYLTTIQDLLGVRALHVFKEDWSEVHEFICANLDVDGDPEAKVWQGDPLEVVEMYRRGGCEIKETAGYRSVHYSLVVRCKKVDLRAELQVRTLFEEGWGEVSHEIDYPIPVQSPMLAQYVSLFTEAATLCDELASAGRLLHEIDGLSANMSASARRRRREACTELLEKMDWLQHKSPAAARLAFPPSNIPTEVALQILAGKPPA